MGSGKGKGRSLSARMERLSSCAEAAFDLQNSINGNAANSQSGTTHGGSSRLMNHVTQLGPLDAAKSRNRIAMDILEIRQ